LPEAEEFFQSVIGQGGGVAATREAGPHLDLVSHEWVAFQGYERIQNGSLEEPTSARKNEEAGYSDTMIDTYR